MEKNMGIINQVQELPITRREPKKLWLTEEKEAKSIVELTT